MVEEMTPYGPTYQRISQICATALAESSRTDPGLFDVITGRLAAAGIIIDRKESQKARSEDPNLVAVVQLLQGEEYLEYIELEGDGFDVYAYDGEVLASLVEEKKALYLCDPPLEPADLDRLRFLERDGLRFVNEDDLWQIFAKKEEERKAKREAMRTVSLVLPDEFLELCAEVKTDPAVVIRGFIADLCDLREGDYWTNGGDERDHAEQYFERCGYRCMARET
jgi:hypothetical protein